MTNKEVQEACAEIADGFADAYSGSGYYAAKATAKEIRALELSPEDRRVAEAREKFTVAWKNFDATVLEESQHRSHHFIAARTQYLKAAQEYAGAIKAAEESSHDE